MTSQSDRPWPDNVDGSHEWQTYDIVPVVITCRRCGCNLWGQSAANPCLGTMANVRRFPEERTR